MSATAAATLINLLGFITGAALYAILLFLVLRIAFTTFVSKAEPFNLLNSNPLLLITALLGITWNIGGLGLYGLAELHLADRYPVVAALIFMALGFLPAVVVHSALAEQRQWGKYFTLAAYSLSTIAGLLNLYAALQHSVIPAQPALYTLTIGFGALVAIMFLTKPQRPTVGLVALAVFAVSALHFSHHDSNYPWWIELLGHQASLPLVLAILYQDYRFAFADLFLKRALNLILLVGLSLLLYLGIFASFLQVESLRQAEPKVISLLLAISVAMALFYPWLQKMVAWLVDRVILQRPDYDRLKALLTQAIAHEEDASQVLNMVAELLAPALNARTIRFWKVSDPAQLQPSWETKFFINRAEPSFAPLQHFWTTVAEPPLTLTAVVVIPTAVLPRYFLGIGELLGGHRLLSDEINLLETIALLVAKHIDTVSVNHERCEISLREQEISKLATEAELRTLRAQINPHFLFNALTTIGYLIQVAPERALETLMRLTGLLRGILRRSEGEFATLGEELEIIRAYLDIEQARFEERLRVKIDVPDQLHSLRIPALLVQPLVENAVKHGITPLRQGGEVSLTATLTATATATAGSCLTIVVGDSGKGLDNNNLATNRQRGVGLNNVERRLHCHYGAQASMTITGQLGEGTIVKLNLPVANKTGSLDGRGLDASLSPSWRSVAK